jgi:hypothetical protein
MPRPRTVSVERKRRHAAVGTIEWSGNLKSGKPRSCVRTSLGDRKRVAEVEA